MTRKIPNTVEETEKRYEEFFGERPAPGSVVRPNVVSHQGNKVMFYGNEAHTFGNCPECGDFATTDGLRTPAEVRERIEDFKPDRFHKHDRQNGR